MPENPEVQSRAALVSRLRAHAQIEDEGHAIDLNQAANEIEDLGSRKTEEAWAFRDRFERHLRRSLAEFIQAETDYEPEVFQSVTDPDDPTSFRLRARTLRLSINLDVKYERSRRG